MSSENSFLKRFDLSGKVPEKSKMLHEPPVINMMANPSYLRQSSALINEALQKGFDVLQLANGDIVTTGTKTVVHQYTWDLDKAKLVKTKADTKSIASEAKLSEAKKLTESLDVDDSELEDA